MTTHTAMNQPAASTLKKLSSSTIVWLALVAYLALVKIILDTFLPHAFADPDQASLFGWVPLGIFSGLGLVGVWLSRKTGFPEAWDKRISNWQRLLIPILAGVGFGALQVGVDRLTGFTKLIAARHGVAQQYTDPVSMSLIFSAAPILVEVLYRLLIIPVLLGLISNVILKGRGQAQVFWGLALLTSALEPFMQFPDLQVLPGAVMAVYALELYALNFTQAAFFRKYGFLAAILIRVGFYMVWHVVYAH